MQRINKHYQDYEVEYRAYLLDDQNAIHIASSLVMKEPNN